MMPTKQLYFSEKQGDQERLDRCVEMLMKRDDCDFSASETVRIALKMLEAKLEEQLEKA